MAVVVATGDGGCSGCAGVLAHQRVGLGCRPPTRLQVATLRRRTEPSLAGDPSPLPNPVSLGTGEPSPFFAATPVKILILRCVLDWCNNYSVFTVTWRNFHRISRFHVLNYTIIHMKYYIVKYDKIFLE